jgi:hypothetical protein
MTREDAEEYSSKSIHIASFAPVAGVLAVVAALFDSMSILRMLAVLGRVYEPDPLLHGQATAREQGRPAQ